MGQLFKGAGYATAIFGKWHLGKDSQSLPTAHGFDEFYGIPPDMTWDSSTYVEKIELTHSLSLPRDVLLARGPQIVEAAAGGQLNNVKPFTPEVRAEIDNESVAKSIDFMKRQKAAGKPFFLYLPFSMGHVPNLPSSAFKGKSRIGNYGDKLMEGDHHVGHILDALQQLGVDDNTLLVFTSDNGPSGEAFREYGNAGTPDMGSPGPFRGELGKSRRARSGPSVLFGGQATSSRTQPPTRCSQSWTSSQPSPPSLGPRCPPTGQLTVLIRRSVTRKERHREA